MKIVLLWLMFVEHHGTPADPVDPSPRARAGARRLPEECFAPFPGVPTAGTQGWKSHG